MQTGSMKEIKTAILAMIFFTLLTGLIYPLAVTGIAQLLFPWQANGSLLQQEDTTVGSLLIGQSFTNKEYFLSRPSATPPFPYNPVNSSGSNLGPSNISLMDAVTSRINDLHKMDPDNHQLIPIDLVTSSASGLDPDISLASAFYQLHRIAKLRGMSEEQLRTLIIEFAQKRFLGIFGEPRVNVLQLNFALDNFTKDSHGKRERATA